MVARTLIRPPSSRIGPITETERRTVIRSSPIAGEYDQTITGDSYYKTLNQGDGLEDTPTAQLEAPVLSGQVVEIGNREFGILQKRIDTLDDRARHPAPPIEKGKP